MTLPVDASDADPLIQKLAAYPETLRQLVLAFRSNPNDAAVDAVVCGILRYHAQDTFDEVHATHGDEMSLFDDLSMDSLTMTEIAFEAEDFLDIILSNEDIKACARKILIELLPVVTALLEKGEAELSPRLIDDIDTLLNAIAHKASAQLREVIKMAKSDLIKKEIFKELGIKITR